MHLDSLQLAGLVKLVLTGPDGEIKDTREIKNLVTTRGKEYITNRMIGTADGVMTHMGVGTSTQAAAAGDTALVAQLSGRSLTSFTATKVQDSTLNDSIDYVCAFGTGDWVGAITEAGIFNASSAGVMLCRTTFSAINKATGDTLTITWRVKTTAS